MGDHALDHVPLRENRRLIRKSRFAHCVTVLSLVAELCVTSKSTALCLCSDSEYPAALDPQAVKL